MAEQLGIRFNKDFGNPLATAAADITQTNADGEPIVPLTQEQKVSFRQKRMVLGAGCADGIGD